MDLERTWILLKFIKRLEKIQNDYNTSPDFYKYFYSALKEETNYLENDKNKAFVNDVCNYFSSGTNYTFALKKQLSNLLSDKNNTEICDFCNKLLKFT
jgi:hypothetical protein